MNFIMIFSLLWTRYTPDLQMIWTASEPPVIGYVLVVESENGDTEMPTAVGQNEATLELALNKKVRLVVVPIGEGNVIWWSQQSEPSDWYVYNKWRAGIDCDPLEVKITWPDTGKAVTVLSTMDLRSWKVEDTMPAGVCQWYEAITSKQKFYKLRSE